MNSLSNSDWIDFDRTKWDDCSNASESDCLTPKGFTHMRWRVAEGVYIDAFNLHTDAGTEDGDESARRSNIQQVRDMRHAPTFVILKLICGDLRF